MKLVVILPTYNERDNIITLLDALFVVFTSVRGYDISYLVVDDNSTDGTKQQVTDFQKKNKNVFMITGKKEGLGKALLRGMAYAVDTLKAEVILQMDADLSHDPKVVPAFLKKIQDGNDIVVGSRYIPGGSIPDNWGLHRKLFSVIGNSFVRFGLGYPYIHDWTGGYRIYKKKFYELYKNDMAQYGGYVFQIAFLHKAILGGARVGEVPIHFTDRLLGRSKIAPAEYIKNIFAYVFGVRIQQLMQGSFGKFLVVGGIGFGLNAIILVALHDYLHWSASVSNVIGAVVAIFSNFNLNNIWTFQHNKVTTLGQYFIKLIQFYATSLFGVLFIQTGTIAIGVRMLGDEKYFLFFLLGTGLLLIWNYVMYSKVIWKKKKTI